LSSSARFRNVWRRNKSARSLCPAKSSIAILAIPLLERHGHEQSHALFGVGSPVEVSPAFAPPSQFARRSEAKGIAFALQGSSLDPVAVNNAD